MPADNALTTEHDRHLGLGLADVFACGHQGEEIDAELCCPPPAAALAAPDWIARSLSGLSLLRDRCELSEQS